MLDRWKYYLRKLICPICDCAFFVDREDWEFYRHCPYCGERLCLPEQEAEE